MPLKLTLKPHEKVIIGGAVIQNGASACHLSIENNVSVLRQADILTESMANTPCRRIYMAIQLMYVDEKSRNNIHAVYLDLVKEVMEAAPSTRDLISQLTQLIFDKKFYQALKLSKKLIHYEEELLKNVTKSN